MIGAHLRIRRFKERFRDLGVLDHAGQPIRAQQQDVSVDKRTLGRFQSNLVFHSQRAHQDILHLTQVRFFWLYEPTADLLGHDGVVRGQPFKYPPVKKIGPAIPDVYKTKPRALKARRDHGSSHTDRKSVLERKIEYI